MAGGSRASAREGVSVTASCGGGSRASAREGVSVTASCGGGGGLGLMLGKV